MHQVMQRVAHDRIVSPNPGKNPGYQAQVGRGPAVTGMRFSIHLFSFSVSYCGSHELVSSTELGNGIR